MAQVMTEAPERLDGERTRPLPVPFLTTQTSCLCAKRGIVHERHVSSNMGLQAFEIQEHHTGNKERV